MKKDRFIKNQKSESEATGAGEELIAGRQAVLEALRFSKPQRLILSEGLKGAIINEITLLARQNRVKLTRLTRQEFQELAGHIPGNQGVAALVSPFVYSSLDELISLSRRPDHYPFLLMLDHLEDPQNLGAIMRTADAAGVDGLIIPTDRAAGVTAAVRKVACGAAERLPVAMVGNLNQAAETLKREGFWIFAADQDGEKEYYRADYKTPLVLVLGSEGKGVSRLLKKNSDLSLFIPMPNLKGGSLNVSAAAAVMIYAVLSQREGWSG